MYVCAYVYMVGVGTKQWIRVCSMCHVSCRFSLVSFVHGALMPFAFFTRKLFVLGNSNEWVSIMSFKFE